MGYAAVYLSRRIKGGYADAKVSGDARGRAQLAPRRELFLEAQGMIWVVAVVAVLAFAIALGASLRGLRHDAEIDAILKALEKATDVAERLTDRVLALEQMFSGDAYRRPDRDDVRIDPPAAAGRDG
jgi:hypothetical protein